MKIRFKEVNSIVCEALTIMVDAQKMPNNSTYFINILYFIVDINFDVIEHVSFPWKEYQIQKKFVSVFSFY